MNCVKASSRKLPTSHLGPNPFGLRPRARAGVQLLASLRGEGWTSTDLVLTKHQDCHGD